MLIFKYRRNLTLYYDTTTNEIVPFFVTVLLYFYLLNTHTTIQNIKY